MCCQHLKSSSKWEGPEKVSWQKNKSVLRKGVKRLSHPLKEGSSTQKEKDKTAGLKIAQKVHTFLEVIAQVGHTFLE